METHPWIEANTPLLSSLNKTKRVRGSRTVSTVARSDLSRLRAAREELEEEELLLLPLLLLLLPPPPPLFLLALLSSYSPNSSSSSSSSSPLPWK